MVDNPKPDTIDLETFLKTAGQSFTEAQRALAEGLDVPVNMMLSNAELELKVSVSSDPQGKMSIKPISSEDISRGGIDPGLLSTIRIAFINSISEIKPQVTPSGDITGTGNMVPPLTGRTLDEAVKIMESSGWTYEAHAASTEDIATAGKETYGRVLHQEPSAGKSADKTKTVLNIWVNLGSIPVKEIDGIGPKFGDSLSRIGIDTVGELSLAKVGEVASALHISEARAQGLMDMANLMSRLTVLGFKDEVVELLVNGASTRSVEQLADADPAELYRVCQEAVASGKVKVPRGFSFTANDVKSWVKTAKAYLNK